MYPMFPMFPMFPKDVPEVPVVPLVPASSECCLAKSFIKLPNNIVLGDPDAASRITA
jgi:hypothetical protein